MALDAGTKLGAFEVTGLLGKGGMGEVYRARDTKLGREVAIKVMPDEIARDAEYLARFEREAVALAALNHPNVAGLHGSDEADGTHFLVMELVEGETLADRIEKGALSVDDAIAIFIQIAEGLEAAHERHLVHRDLKPANIKITPKGVVKILDFGMAKETGLKTPELSAPDAVTKPMSPSPGTLTTAGMILGTPNYMSPEQARGLPVDKRTDIWAFGCCLFQALTGEIPFQGSTVMDILSSVLERTPKFDKLPSHVPRQLTRVLRRCLEKDPDQRLHDIADARVELVDANSNPFYEVADDGGLSRRSSPIVLTSTLALGIMIGAASLWTTSFFSQRSTEPKIAPQIRRFEIPIAEKFRADSSFKPFELSRDGSMLVYAGVDDGGVRVLYVRDLERGADTQLPGTKNGLQPTFSPDGEWVAYFDPGGLNRVSVLGGAAQLISKLPTSSPRGASWGPDDTIAFAPTNASTLLRVPAAGGDGVDLTASAGEVRLHRWPQMLPGRQSVLFTARKGAGGWDENASLYVVSIVTGEVKEVLHGGYHGRYLKSGHLVYALRGTLMAVPFDLATLETVGRPVPVLNDLRTNSNIGFAYYDVSDDGLLAYVAGDVDPAVEELIWVDHHGEQEVIYVGTGNWGTPSISPDGSRVAVNSVGDLHVLDIARGTLSRLTFQGEANLSPVWTPDGQEIVYASLREGTVGYGFYRKAADGSTAEIEILGADQLNGLTVPSSVTQDGNTIIYYGVTESGGFDIWAAPMNQRGDIETLLSSRFNEGRGKLSPDGKWFAYSSDETGVYEVYVRRFPDMSGKWQVSINGGGYPLWAPDLSRMYYRAPGAVMAVDLDLSEGFVADQPVELFKDHYSASAGYQWDISPDGERFLMVDEGRSDASAGVGVSLNAVTNWFEELNRLAPHPGTN